jgi:hypothetical protein
LARKRSLSGPEVRRSPKSRNLTEEMERHQRAKVRGGWRRRRLEAAVRDGIEVVTTVSVVFLESRVKMG